LIFDRTVARLIVPVALIAACDAPPTAPSSSTLRATRTSAHFLFEYPETDAAAIATIASVVEAEYARVLADLGVDRMPQVRVTFYASHGALEAATRDVAGVIPALAAGLVTSESAIHMMSPGAAGWGPVDRVAVDVVHEFAHCASLHLNPRIANNPRWLWESVAVYEAGQRVDLRTVPYMAALAPPPFDTLNGFDNTRVYEVGYSIAEFIVSRWGQPALARLVAANGDTAAVLGVPLGDFQTEWFAFVRSRYQL